MRIPKGIKLNIFIFDLNILIYLPDTEYHSYNIWMCKHKDNISINRFGNGACGVSVD